MVLPLPVSPHSTTKGETSKEAVEGTLLGGLGALLRSDSLVDAERHATVLGSALGLVAEVTQIPHLTLFLITPKVLRHWYLMG